MNELKGVSGIETAVNALVSDVTSRASEMIVKAKELSAIVTTEDNLADRKKDRAEINKMAAGLDRERKDIEKGWKGYLAPLTDAYKKAFEDLNAEIKTIDRGLDEFEQARIAERNAKINEIFGLIEKPSEIADWIALSDIFNKKWLNISYTEKQIRKDIEDEFANLKFSYDTVISLNHKYQEDGLQVLRDSKDLQRAIAKMTALADQERIIEERRKAEEERKAAEKARLEAEKKAEEERRAEEARREEEARKAEEARREEEARRAEEARRIDEEKEYAAAHDFAYEKPEILDVPPVSDMPFGSPKEPEVMPFEAEQTEEALPFAFADEQHYIVRIHVSGDSDLDELKKALSYLGYVEKIDYVVDRTI